MEEMKDLLRAVSSSNSPPRLSAVHYTRCRDALLSGELRSAVPGFILQCVSIYKFYDFINLYDADPEARVAFVDNAFSKGKNLADGRRSRDSFNDFDF